MANGLGNTHMEPTIAKELQTAVDALANIANLLNTQNQPIEAPKEDKFPDAWTVAKLIENVSKFDPNKKVVFYVYSNHLKPGQRLEINVAEECNDFIEIY